MARRSGVTQALLCAVPPCTEWAPGSHRPCRTCPMRVSVSLSKTHSHSLYVFLKCLWGRIRQSSPCLQGRPRGLFSAPVSPQRTKEKRPETNHSLPRRPTPESLLCVTWGLWARGSHLATPSLPPPRAVCTHTGPLGGVGSCGLGWPGTQPGTLCLRASFFQQPFC